MNDGQDTIKMYRNTLYSSLKTYRSYFFYLNHIFQLNEILKAGSEVKAERNGNKFETIFKQYLFQVLICQHLNISYLNFIYALKAEKLDSITSLPFFYRVNQSTWSNYFLDVPIKLLQSVNSSFKLIHPIWNSTRFLK